MFEKEQIKVKKFSHQEDDFFKSSPQDPEYIDFILKEKIKKNEKFFRNWIVGSSLSTLFFALMFFFFKRFEVALMLSAILQICVIVVIISSLPHINQDLDEQYVSIDKHQECRSYSMMQDMEDVARYMEKIEKMGRFITNKEYALIKKKWLDNIFMRKTLSFKGSFG